MDREITLRIYGENHKLRFVKSEYMNNKNLAIVVQSEDEDYPDCWEEWCSLTVNLVELPFHNKAYLDTNNCSKEIINWLFENKYAIDMNAPRISGYCSYPLVEFSSEFMNMLFKMEEI